MRFVVTRTQTESITVSVGVDEYGAYGIDPGQAEQDALAQAVGYGKQYDWAQQRPVYTVQRIDT